MTGSIRRAPWCSRYTPTLRPRKSNRSSSLLGSPCSGWARAANQFISRAGGNHPMRVLVVADPHLPVPPAQYGGTERIVHLLCHELASRGFVVDLLAGKGSKAYSGELYIHTAPTRNY